MNDINWPLVIATSALGLFAMVFFAYVYQTRLDHQRETKQKLGLEYLLELKSLLAILQNHRGLSTRILWGDKRLEPDLDTYNKNIERRLESLDHFKYHDFLASRWNTFKEDWAQLHESQDTLTAEENIERHNHIILVFIFFITDVAQQHDIADTYLKKIKASHKNWKQLITLTEWIGQARVLGAGMLNQSHHGRIERIRMSFIHTKLLDYADEINAEANTKTQLEEFVSLLDREFLKNTKSTLTSTAYFNHASRVIESCMRQFDADMYQLRNRIH